MKPRIRLWPLSDKLVQWHCYGANCHGIGPTPRIAYHRWLAYFTMRPKERAVAFVRRA